MSPIRSLFTAHGLRHVKAEQDSKRLRKRTVRHMVYFVFALPPVVIRLQSSPTALQSTLPRQLTKLLKNIARAYKADGMDISQVPKHDSPLKPARGARGWQLPHKVGLCGSSLGRYARFMGSRSSWQGLEREVGVALRPALPRFYGFAQGVFRYLGRSRSSQGASQGAALNTHQVGWLCMSCSRKQLIPRQ